MPPPASCSNGTSRTVSQWYNRPPPGWLSLPRRHQPVGCMRTRAQMELEEGQFTHLHRWSDSLRVPIAWSHLDWILTRGKGICNPFRSPLGSLWPHASNYAFKYRKQILSKNASTYIVVQYTPEQFVEWCRGRDHVTFQKKSKSCRQDP